MKALLTAGWLAATVTAVFVAPPVGIGMAALFIIFTARIV
jgi:hypothetical protein